MIRNIVQCKEAYSFKTKIMSENRDTIRDDGHMDNRPTEKCKPWWHKAESGRQTPEMKQNVSGVFLRTGDIYSEITDRTKSTRDALRASRIPREAEGA